ncbi:MAG: kinase [Bacteroidales bacterium]|nr:kinase [Bacteroidales bacterium]
MATINLTAKDGSPVSFVDEIIGSGGMKDVYFSPDRSYVVAFFRDPQDANARDRLDNIVSTYRQRIFDQPGGEYWKELFCWPTKIVEHAGKLGIVAPTYAKHFFFAHGSKNNDMLQIKGKEKQGKWFAAAKLRSKFLHPQELGDWRMHLTTCIKICRAVRRMHAAGLAHSDLSYKNVLIDPVGGNACIIDIDGLVVPGKYPPDVVGTADFIAPEVMATLTLPKGAPNRALPRIETDRHALAVLVYMYLLYRHPLRGGKIHDTNDPQKDEELGMGPKALFIEHPSDASNRPRVANLQPSELPWGDVTKRPYSIVGPYLRDIFNRAFIDGLHDPNKRPTANDWELALVKTVDLIQPCANPNCEQKWYVFDNSTKPACPFCSTPYSGELPVINLYSSRGKGKFLPDNHRLMVYTNQYLYPWHVNRTIFPNEKLSEEQRKPVGYFVLHNGKWVLVNQRLPALKDVTQNKEIPINTMVELVDGQQLLLSPEDGGRLLQIQMVKA